VFVYRHYISDKGKFPAAMLEELGLAGGQKVAKYAGILAFLALALGVKPWH
jgi:hypothetical protein